MTTEERTYNTYKRIEKNGDTLTPITIFKRLEGPKKFLLESSFQHKRKGKYSYIGASPYLEIIGRGRKTTTVDTQTGEERTFAMHALDYIKKHLPKITTDIPLPFTGGAIGYVGYDAIREFVEISDHLPDQVTRPEVHWLVYDTIIADEHRTENVHILTENVRQERVTTMEEKIAQLEKTLQTQVA